ncbi:MAG: LPS assembly protein LptD [Mariprofundaceae bacterium]|nr:LPS assembly protein LptD [Mariprofundaceae bacterium]
MDALIQMFLKQSTLDAYSIRHRFPAMLRTWLILPRLYTLGFVLSLGLLPEAATAVDVVADTVTQDAGGAITAEGSVIIERADETLAADRVIYDAKKKEFKASGNVNITSKGSTIRAESGEMHTVNKTGELHDAEATLKGGERLKSVLLKRDENGIITAEEATITSCPPDAEAWLLKAGHVELDQENGLLTAKNASFELAGIPVLYAPYWRQTLRRKSGFLTPFVSTGKTRGTEVALPYYFAPEQDWDATLTPHWMTARGFKGEAELRHISAAGHEKIQIEGLNDKVASRQRGRARGDIQRALPHNIAFSANADHISDRNYLADFATDSDAISRSYLQSMASLSQSRAFDSWTLLVQHQQDLTTPSNAATLQILPRFESSVRVPVASNAVSLELNQQTTRFARRTGVDGWRLDLNPVFEVPWQLPGGGIESTLRVGGRHTRYWLKDTIGQNILSRNTFEASLDNRISFERISEERNWRHTITPTLRYDFIAAPDQSALPNFDSSFGQLSMSNLLTGNRFTGHDRVERINRVSLLLETGLQHKEQAASAARDIVNAKLGAAYELKRESVDPATLAAATRPFSNLLGEISIYPIAGIAASAGGQYNPADRYWATVYSALNMASERGDSLNVSWQHTDGRYAAASELITSHATLRVARRWSLFGSWQYDPRLKLTQQGSGGIHYLHPCWDLRVEGYRNNLNGSSATSDFGFRFLLGFKGLGSVGS